MNKIIKIPIEKVELNTGQIPDVPENPRIYTTEQVEVNCRFSRDDGN